MDGYDALLLLDAHQDGAKAGTVRLIEPSLPDLSGLDPHQVRDYFADTHYATPLRALALLERLGRLPAHIAVLGCEPASVEPMRAELSSAVAAALARAERLALDWLASMAAPRDSS
jgi:hydrogenase maturation protease